jgi:hypothetical protein
MAMDLWCIVLFREIVWRCVAGSFGGNFTRHWKQDAETRNRERTQKNSNIKFQNSIHRTKNRRSNRHLIFLLGKEGAISQINRHMAFSAYEFRSILGEDKMKVLSEFQP